MQNLIYITYLAELLPFILCLIFIKKIKSLELKVFFFYTAAFAFFLCLSLYFKFQVKNPTLQLIVNRFFLIVEFTFLSLFYNYGLNYRYKNIISFSAITLFIGYSTYDFYMSKPGEFSFIPLVIECLFFVFVIVYYFYERMQYSISSPIYYSPGFWISVAFLIYFSGNFFLFLFSKSMLTNPSFRQQYIIIYGVVTIIKNIFLCVAIAVNAYLVNHEIKSELPVDIDLGTFNPLTNQHNP